MISLRTVTSSIALAPFVVVACSKGTAETSPSSGSASAAASASASAAVAASSAASGATPAIPLSLTPSAYMSIPERFASEAIHRPPGLIVRVEPTTAAFRKAGLAITDEKQHLASPYQAKFCVGAKAKLDEVTFSICEYDTEKQAAEGAALNDKSFKFVKNRQTHRNGATTLTILEAAKNDENDAVVKKLVELFQAQKPAPAPGADGGTAAPSSSASGSAAPSASAAK
ncbi:MAG: hypothetical protein JST00_42490 [Deltaproteobacteria bacterium]|nr:hypothetical protein [Deltaproteobacteria bacterium]